MNIFSFLKKNNFQNKKNKEKFTKSIDHSCDYQIPFGLLDSLEEKFIRIDILIEKCNFVLQDKFELDISSLEISKVEQLIRDGINLSRQSLIDRLVKHRDDLLKKCKPKTSIESFLKFKTFSRQPIIDDYFFSTYFHLDHRIDLKSKVKYLKLFNKSHEVMNKKKPMDYFNNWYGELDILPLSENRLLYYFKTSNSLQIRSMNGEIISKIYIDFNTLYVDCFDFISFKANSASIVCLRHIYNQSLILVFDMELHELKRLLVVYKSDFCSVSEKKILMKEINSNKYHLYNFELEELTLETTSRDESIIKLTDDKIYSFESLKGMNLITIASRSSEKRRIRLSLFTKQPINRNQIKIDLNQKCIIVLERDRLKLFDMSGSFICESEKDIFLKTCDSIELVNDFDEKLNKNSCIYLINRFKNTFYYI